MERRRVRTLTLPLTTRSPESQVQSYLAKGRAHQEAGDLDAAEAAYQQALAIRPTHGVAHLLLVRLAMARGDLATACERLNGAIQVVPPDPQLHDTLGRLRVQLGQPVEAIESFRAAVELDPSSAAGQFALGTALSSHGDLRAAVPHLSEAARLAPDSEHARLELEKAATIISRYQAYDQQIESMRQSPYMEYPARVCLETLTLCTAACTFCPYATLDRKGYRMPDALIAKVIDDLTAIPSDLPFTLLPFKVNDPFVDVRIFDILDEVGRRLPNAQIELITNAVALTEKKLERLAHVKNLKPLRISLNDHRPDEYEALMQMPFARTIDRLETISRAKADGRFDVPVVLTRVGDGSQADLEFQTWVAERFPDFHVSIQPRSDWLGQVDMPGGFVPDMGCSMWFELSITSTGVVAHCCMDGEARHPIGDVREQHVLEVYNSPEFRRLREATASRWSVSPCNSCAMY